MSEISEFFACTIIFLAGVIVGTIFTVAYISNTQNPLEVEAIKRGYMQYVMTDTATGKTVLVWKEQK